MGRLWWLPVAYAACVHINTDVSLLYSESDSGRKCVLDVLTSIYCYNMSNKTAHWQMGLFRFYHTRSPFFHTQRTRVLATCWEQKQELVFNKDSLWAMDSPPARALVFRSQHQGLKTYSIWQDYPTFLPLELQSENPPSGYAQTETLTKKGDHVSRMLSSPGESRPKDRRLKGFHSLVLLPGFAGCFPSISGSSKSMLLVSNHCCCRVIRRSTG